MAKRYSGNLQVSVVYDDKGHYRTAVSSGGKLLWRGIVNPAPAGFGPGIAYDSPKAYDEIASSALAFADDEVGGIGDEAEFDEGLTGYLIRRSRRSAAGRSTHAHATVAKAPPGMRNIATTYQLAYETYDGDVQVRKIGDRLWEVLPRGGASFYEKSRQAAIERAFQLDASRSRKAKRRTRR